MSKIVYVKLGHSPLKPLKMLKLIRGYHKFLWIPMKVKPLLTIFQKISNCISTKLELSTRFLAIESQHSENKLLSVLNEQYYQHIYHTLAIEGNTLTPQEVR